ncbi:DNA polymerase IV [bacterium]|nr:DNA polymerase IV [bacterium]
MIMRPELRQRLQDEVVPRERKPQKTKLVAHADMDAFFASVEERDNPALRGKPVIVGGQPGTRGVVTTANYEARKYGIHAGMSLTKAGLLCPNGIYVRTHGGKYSWVSIQVMAIFRKYSPSVEPASIDEAYLDIASCADRWGGPGRYAETIRREVRQTLGVTVSIGVGPNKITAKIASGLNKPDGQTILPLDNVLSVLGPLSVREIPGVGASTEEVLSDMGIHTIRELADCPVRVMQNRLGKYGEALRRIIRGEIESEITPLEERVDDKSMGHEHTFHEDVQNRDTLLARLLQLVDKATRRMRRDKYVGTLVILKLRSSQFRTRTHQRQLHHPTSDPFTIFRVGQSLLDEIWREEDGSVRLIGVSVGHLFRPGEECQGLQEDMFETPKAERLNGLFSAVDRLRDIYGEHVLEFAGGMEMLRRAGSIESVKH